MATLKELQSAYDNLKTTERDLNAFPPEMAHLDKSVKTSAGRIQEIHKKIALAKALLEDTEQQHQMAVKAEAYARKDLKGTANKAQYTVAMRGLDEKERLLEGTRRTLKEAEATLKSLEDEMEALVSTQNDDKRQFGELHEVFLSEHENQVAAKDILTKKIAELIGKLDAVTLNKFNRLMDNRGGRAVVATENGACTGCNTKLRKPLVYKLRAEGSITCEFCQRILYLPESAG